MEESEAFAFSVTCEGVFFPGCAEFRASLSPADCVVCFKIVLSPTPCQRSLVVFWRFTARFEFPDKLVSHMHM